jgi:hypothetical protein
MYKKFNIRTIITFDRQPDEGGDVEMNNTPKEEKTNKVSESLKETLRETAIKAKVENSPLETLDSIVKLSAAQTPKATTKKDWVQYCREDLGIEGDIYAYDLDDVENIPFEPMEYDIYPHASKAEKSYAKTINLLAEGNSGKTFTMCYWALCYAYGVALYNNPRCPVSNNERKGVIILSLEEGAHLQLKQRQVKKGMIDIGHISKDDPHGHILTITPSDTRFFELDEQGQYAVLGKICEKYNIGMIYVDSASALSSENGADDFNSNGKMLQVLKPIRNLQAKYGLNGIFLNHPRKPMGFGGKLTQQDINGASAQANISKSITALWKDPKDNHILNYQVIKGNDLTIDEQQCIYRVEIVDGEPLPNQDNIEEKKKKHAVIFKLKEIKNEEEMKEERAQNRAEKKNTFEQTMKILYGMYFEMGQGSQNYIATWANSHKNEKGEYDMKTKTGKDWTADNLANNMGEYIKENNLPRPTHSYKDYLAKQVGTAMKADEQRKEYLENAPSDEGWFDKYDSLKLQDGDKIRLSSYSNKLTDYSLSEPINVTVKKDNDTHIRFLLEDKTILEGLSKGENDENIDYYYENYTLD